MMNYAQGGLANVAQSLANKGRNGDTELVHMSPREVNGLQALARANGTSLTMNPNTGLPEAFRLEQLLPMAAGAALTATGVGAPLAALMVGGAYGAATGSIEKGLMAGIGAYGGAGLATGLSTAGASAVAPEAAVSTVVPEAGASAVAPEVAANYADGISQLTPTSSGVNYADGLSQYSPGSLPNAGANQAASEYFASEGFAGSGSAANQTLGANQAAQMTAANQTPTFANMGKGIESLGTSQGRSIAYGAMPTGTLPATAGTLLMAGQQQPNVPGYQEDAYDRRLKGYKLSPNYQPYQAPTPNPYYRPTYAADGGVMNSFDDSSGMDEPAGLAQGNLQKGLFGLGYADGGLSLGGYSDGGRMLKGPGDGMSDSIPGVIGGKQPARLADGEFVVPADVVSHLGNGSTDAGAKKLYSMMDKIRQARTGKKKQAPQVNVDKYLPMGKASGGITGYAEGGVIGYANGGTTYSDQAVNSFVRDMINSGVGGAEIGRALAANGISQAQAVTATGLDAGTVAQSYAGGASLPAISSAANLPIRPTSETTIPNFGANQVASYLVTNNITTPAEEAEVQRMFNVNNTTLAEAKRLIAATDPSIQAATDAYQRSIQANPNLAIQNALTTEARMKDLGITSGIPNAVAATERTAVQKAAADKQAAIDKFNETASTSIAAYRPSFVPRVSGINMSPTMQDPYSNAGLEALYSQMMGQYKAPTQPMSDAQIRAFAQDFANRNPGKGAELGQALINQGIPVNQAIAATGLSPGTLNTAYIGGQGLGTAAPPTLNTQYNYSDPGSYYRPAPVSNLVLKNPITDAVTAEANQAKADAVAAANASTAGDAGGAGSGGERAGGLMSIDRKKRAKYKK